MIFLSGVFGTLICNEFGLVPRVLDLNLCFFFKSLFRGLRAWFCVHKICMSKVVKNTSGRFGKPYFLFSVITCCDVLPFAFFGQRLKCVVPSMI